MSFFTLFNQSSSPTAPNATQLTLFAEDDRLKSIDSSSVVVDYSGNVVGPSAGSTDNALARFDTNTGVLLQDSLGILNDLGALSGLTQLNVDNIQINGNEISSTDTDGDIILSPNGTGDIDFANSKGINALDPTAAQDIATKNYVDTTGGNVTTSDTLTANTLLLGNGGVDLINAAGLTSTDGLILGAIAAATQTVGFKIIGADAAIRSLWQHDDTASTTSFSFTPQTGESISIFIEDGSTNRFSLDYSEVTKDVLMKFELEDATSLARLEFLSSDEIARLRLNYDPNSPLAEVFLRADVAGTARYRLLGDDGTTRYSVTFDESTSLISQFFLPEVGETVKIIYTDGRTMQMDSAPTDSWLESLTSGEHENNYQTGVATTRSISSNSATDLISRIYGLGISTDTDTEFLDIGWDQSEDVYRVTTDQSGTGLKREIQVFDTRVQQIVNTTTDLSNISSVDLSQIQEISFSDTIGFTAANSSATIQVIDYADSSNPSFIGEAINEFSTLQPIVSWSAQPFTGIATLNFNDADEMVPEGAEIVISGSGQAAYNGTFTTQNRIVDEENSIFSFEIPVAFINDPTTKGSFNDVIGLLGGQRIIALGNIIYWVNNTGRLLIFDSTDLAAPKRIGNLDNLGAIRDIKLLGQILYLCGNDDVCRFRSIDISDPTRPTLLDVSSIAESYRGFTVYGDLAYCPLIGGIRVFDVSDPSEITSVALFTDATNLTDPVTVQRSGQRLYISDEDDGTFLTYDITDPTAISFVNSLTVTANDVFDFVIVGLFVYIGLPTDNEIRVLQIDDPDNPALGPTISTVVDTPRRLTIKGEFLFIASSGDQTIDAFSLHGFNTHAATIGQLEVDWYRCKRQAHFDREIEVGGASAFNGPVSLNNSQNKVDGKNLFGDPHNVVRVTKQSDLPTPTDIGFGLEIVLEPNIVYRFYNDNPEFGQKFIDIDTPIRFPEGVLNACAWVSENLGATVVRYTGTGTMFNASTNYFGFFSFQNIFCACPNGTLFDIDGVLPVGFEFFPRVSLSFCGFFQVNKMGSISTISCNYTTGSFFSVTGADQDTGLVLTNMHEFVFENVRFTDWVDGADLSVIRIKGNSRFFRMSGCTFDQGPLSSIFRIDPDVDQRDEILLSNNQLQGLASPFSPTQDLPIGAITDASVTGTTTNFANDGSGNVEVTFSGGVIGGELATLIGATETTYNGTFRLSSASPSILEKEDGTFVQFVANDSGNFRIEAIQIAMASTAGFVSGSSKSLLGTINYDGGNPQFATHSGTDGQSATGSFFDSVATPDWDAVGTEDFDILEILSPPSAAGRFIINSTNSGAFLSFDTSTPLIGTFPLANAQFNILKASIFGKEIVYDVIVDTSIRMNRFFVATETGANAILQSQIDERDERVISIGNVGIPISANIAAISAQLVTDATVIALTGVFVDLNLEAAATPKANSLAATQQWTLVNSTTGEVRYDGLNDFNGSIFVTLSSSSSGGSQEFEFRALKNGSAIQDNNAEDISSRNEFGSNLTNTSLIVPTTAINGDLFRLQVANNDGTSNIVINSVTYIIQ